MRKIGTKITYKGTPFNPDGDHNIDWGNVNSDEMDYNEAFEDKHSFFLRSEKGMLYGLDKLKFRKKGFLLMEPNPVSFYFSIANDTAMQIQDAYSRLENLLSKNDNSPNLSIAYSYVFKVTSICILFAYTACDAFLNQMIPEYKKIKMDETNKEWSKQEIERLPFEKKLKAVSIYANNYFEKKHPIKLKKLGQLKDFRNRLIHLKEAKQNPIVSYNDIYQDILDTDLIKTVKYVKDFINFYKPGLIINYRY
ncbi:hypothetical protein [Sphingobacterium hotanense]|uniref:hypothetical protein n=1 Tax=Sphingobacterium hotanense TaxID=649196 RepID=UPI0021A92952|nr:hypothetical protein [Sphingobacterium hotanense]MCT1525648.1 hypothetical protein [Sphingobacterium hotanense]